ncbi:MAG: hypothetical protein L3K15_00960 [Thermoplasmata archaeon]|nr:hypothetical protein [Thermoplasmata archaeon]
MAADDGVLRRTDPTELAAQRARVDALHPQGEDSMHPDTDPLESELEVPQGLRRCGDQHHRWR